MGEGEVQKRLEEDQAALEEFPRTVPDDHFPRGAL